MKNVEGEVDETNVDEVVSFSYAHPALRKSIADIVDRASQRSVRVFCPLPPVIM